MYLTAHIGKCVSVAFPRGSDAKKEKALLLFCFQQLLIPMESRMMSAELEVEKVFFYFIIIILNSSLLIYS